MQKLLITLLLLVNTPSYACQCLPAQFTDQDTQNAVLKFMANKLEVPEANITEIKKTSSEGFLGFIGNTVMAAFTIGMEKNQKSCEMACAEDMNEKSTFEVTYSLNGKNCIQPLTVKMKSAVFKTGYSSSVKKNVAPYCSASL